MLVSRRPMQIIRTNLPCGHPCGRLLDFAELRRVIGFDDYFDTGKKYAGEVTGGGHEGEDE